MAVKKKLILKKQRDKIISKDSKLFIQYTKDGEKQPRIKEIILFDEGFKKNPEKVSVSIGTTISPKEFESIRIDYHCEIHHQPGHKFRQTAFDMAKATILERLEDDVVDLHATGMIKEHYLLPQDKIEVPKK